MRIKNIILTLSVFSGLSCVYASASADELRYRVIDSVPLDQVTGWDSLSIDPETRTLFITDNAGVLALNIDTLRPIQRIAPALGRFRGAVHAVAISQKLSLGFISIEAPSSVVAFDLKSYRVKYTTKVDQGADEIAYSPFSERIFTLNGKASKVHDVSIIDAKSGKFVKNIQLPSRPESGAIDNSGHLYVSMPELSAIADIDTRSLNLQNIWHLNGCVHPSALAIDSNDDVLFASCEGQNIIAFDISSHRLIGKISSGLGTDEMKFSDQNHHLFASSGSGTLTIGKYTPKNKFSLIDTIKTGPGARNMALDTKTNRIFAMSAVTSGRTTPSAGNPHGYGTAKPETVKLIVIGK